MQPEMKRNEKAGSCSVCGETVFYYLMIFSYGVVFSDLQSLADF